MSALIPFAPSCPQTGSAWFYETDTFIPDELPLKNIDWSALIEALSEANRELGNLRGTLKGIVNPSVLLSPLTTREAVLSSKIEGTQATLQEVLFYEALPDENNPKKNDIQEVVNYRKTLAASVTAIKEKPLHLNMLKSLHAVLLDSVRGEYQRPGEFRLDQNRIGPKGCTIEQAFFIPPEPRVMMEALGNWETYWHLKERDALVQLAIMHAQFEIIHPFRDGNGRIGRVLIPIFLMDKGILDEPVFYLSEYLESHRDAYAGALRSISDNGSWAVWFSFFLTAIAKQAIAIRLKAENILKLYEAMKREIYDLGTTFGLPALDTLFTLPIFSSSEFVRYSGIPKASAHRLLVELQERKVIQVIEEGQGRRPTTFTFNQLLDITEVPLESQE
jgi:Fic family protein